MQNLIAIGIVELLPSGRYVKRWAVQGRAINPYTVSIDKEGQHGCSCPDWAKHSPRQDCKHILRLKLALMKGAEPVIPVKSAPMPKRTGRRFR